MWEPVGLEDQEVSKEGRYIRQTPGQNAFTWQAFKGQIPGCNMKKFHLHLRMAPKQKGCLRDSSDDGQGAQYENH